MSFRIHLLTFGLLVAFSNSVDSKLSAKEVAANHEVATAQPFRVATFNVSMESGNYGDEASSLVLQQELASGDNPQIQAIAAILQKRRPDIVLLNEFDYIADTSKGINAFQDNYLGISQRGDEPIRYDYFYLAESNTGELSPVDINDDGTLSLPADAYGFGLYPGHYAMVLLSRFPIDSERVRTFRTFLWKDMPGALKPLKEDGSGYYSAEVWNHFRLSSKSHWDVPVLIGGKALHVLASHPTPPVFDGEEDRNGRRNNDEIRFWADYVSPDEEISAYIYDDAGEAGGMASDEPFVILGDLNASDCNGDSYEGAIQQLLEHPSIVDPRPDSDGATEAWPGDDCARHSTHIAGWRLDYVLPSSGESLQVLDSGVYWPETSSPDAELFEDRSKSSDHRLVWLDLELR
ncbi:endonuclease/exonuclease/phosphatase family protein [Pelagicoccus albus]|uniref:Endonuclease/exonuclease/phosphatase family protein n=1 Tax=Pelagicoccus albus TaxID=415222 RepID=A0A7X1EBH9_9BACT|nr:endonuclease/exonuclease/phosphatase family protein [Pelagicoccus albus]MBC2607837.1 endonuclease/exonuclease/phosphatase family protein [Pelagicoccus albus]